MQIIDISRELTTAPLYPGTPAPQIIPLMRIGENGATYNLSDFAFGAHIATHCDACWHFVADGADIAAMPLEHYVGECYVMDVPENTLVSGEFVRENLPQGVTRLLIRGGGNSFLSNEAADYIAASGVITVGTDGWSVSPLNNESRIHRVFLGGGIAIIEQLELSAAEQGYYFLSAAPVKIAGADGAPCRAVLMRE
jgi:arylformamidase